MYLLGACYTRGDRRWCGWWGRGGVGSVNLNLKTIHILTKDSELPHGWLER